MTDLTEWNSNKYEKNLRQASVVSVYFFSRVQLWQKLCIYVCICVRYAKSELENIGRHNHNGYGFNMHAREFKLKKRKPTHDASNFCHRWKSNLSRFCPKNCLSARQYTFILFFGCWWNSKKNVQREKRVPATNERWKNNERT